MSNAVERPDTGRSSEFTNAIVETSGPTVLPIGPIAPGEFLQRVGNQVVGVPSPSGSVDPRDIFRFSMIHNVGVTGGG